MSKKGSTNRASNAWTMVIVAALVVLNLAVYLQVRHHPVVSLDDRGYVSENSQVLRGLTPAGVEWAFTTGHMANWHPLTWLSHMLDVSMFGMDPGAFHVVNVALHAINTLLLFLLLHLATGCRGRSAFVAALFAVHPLHVESVAWIAERKDVLSTLFWMATMLAYIRYAVRPSTAARGALSKVEGRKSDSRTLYLLVIVLFALGLMAKPMLVTLPLVLLLLDAWPLSRIASDRFQLRAWLPLVVEKIPLFVLALASTVVTIVVQQRGGAVGALWAFPFPRRLANALVACVWYLAKTVWPSNLSAFYPYPASFSWWQPVAALCLLIVISVLVVHWARRFPFLAVGWFWYLITLLPVIGLIQVGRQAYADRYTYVPLLGIFIIAAWGLPELVARSRAIRRLLPVAAALVVVAFATAARAQAGYWRSDAALWQHALEVDPQNYIAQIAVGEQARIAGRNDEALALLSQAVRTAPDYPQARHALGMTLFMNHRADEAIGEYEAALALSPDFADAHNHLAIAMQARGDMSSAVEHFDRAAQLRPDSAKFHNDLGQALAKKGDVSQATTHFAEAIRLDPSLATAHENMAVALFAEGRIDEAISEYGEAIRLEPGNAEAHNKLGFALATQGKVAEAIPHFAEAVRLRPDFEAAHQFLGTALGAAGRFDEAAAQFREVLRINPTNEGALRGLEALKKYGPR